MSKLSLVLVIVLIAMLSLNLSSPLSANTLFPEQPSTAPEATSTLAFNPIADAYVDQAHPTASYAAAPALLVDGSPVMRSYLRFAIQGISGTVSKVVLRIYANSALASGYGVYRVASNTWAETTINYSNAPVLGALVGSSGAVTAGSWTQVDVTSYVRSNGVFSLALASSNATALSLASRQSTSRPLLLVTLGGVAPATRPSTPTGPTTKSGDRQMTLRWNSNPEPNIRYYKVYWSLKSAGPFSWNMSALAPSTSVTKTGLVNGSTYYFRISAVDSAGQESLQTAVVSAKPGTLPPTPSSDPIVLFTGDSRSGCTSGAAATAKLLDNFPTSVPLLFNGDAVNTGKLSELTDCFNTTYGQHKAQVRPVPGNHEYGTSGASGYYTYFGAQAGPAGKGYYSFNVGSWHIVALNSEISVAAGSAQEAWLKADLAAHPTKCTLAYWHEPRFSSGEHGNNTAMNALFTDLYNANAELVLGGHDHDYERFAPQTPSGALDNARGIRQFVVGTGGVPERPFGTIRANSQVRNNNTYGILKLTLHASSYDWQFLQAGGGTFTDSGSTLCH